jgi:hypothetical protein
MKNKIYQILVIVLVSTSVFAQTENVEEVKKTKFSHEIGFNSMALVKQIFNFSNTTTNAESPYLAMYKLGFGKNFIRTSVGGNYNSKKDQVEGFLDSKTTTKSDVFARFGFERQTQLKSKIRMSFGIDAVYEYHDNAVIIDSGLDQAITIDKENIMGVGPVMGIHFQLNKHLSLYTETAFYYSYSTTLKQKDFVKNPEFKDTENESKGKKASFLPPTGLFLLYQF